MRLILVFLLALALPVFAQEQKTLTFDQIKEIQTELIKQKLIRIVEPAILELQVLGKKSSYLLQYDVFKNCDKSVQTELGYAFVKCFATPPSIRYFEGGPLEDYYGDRMINVTVEGYETAENLEEKTNPVVIGKLLIMTKVHRYTKKDELDREEFIKQQNGGALETSSGRISILPIKAGDPARWDIVASKVTYEFPMFGK